MSIALLFLLVRYHGQNSPLITLTLIKSLLVKKFCKMDKYFRFLVKDSFVSDNNISAFSFHVLSNFVFYFYEKISLIKFDKQMSVSFLFTIQIQSLTFLLFV